MFANMRREVFMESSSAENNTHPPPVRKARSLCLSFPSEADYQFCIADRRRCRDDLQEQFHHHPELFPAGWAEGFTFHGFVTSHKQGLRQRRVKLKATGHAYQIRPSFMMPYMIGRTAEVEKALFLRRWGVPFEALAYVFGRHPMYWYRAYVSLGRASIVGTTLKDPARLPAHVLADEKHTRLDGEKVYVATTVAHECILGAEVVEQADTPTLTHGYQVFRQEARELNPEYQPHTVTTDKWEATRQAWKGLFPLSTLILCFLHAVLKIKNRCRSDRSRWAQLREKVWHVYGAPTLAAFAQRLRRLREWATPQPLLASAKEKVLDLCDHAADFKKAYAHPGAYRTSNALERLMNYQDRVLYAMQYFHGHIASASLYARAMALVWNFHPYDQRTQKKYGPRASPFERVNGFRYHDNWLENLMVAASLRGRKPSHKIR
jgi:hypothetical protein